MGKEKWYFIDSGDSPPSYNMALDEALLTWHSEGKIKPVIRFYGWEPATLSIGYFQKARKDIDFDALKAQNVGFVRRPTGGRAVLHEHEITYSIVVSESHPDMPTTVTEAYRVISGGILKGFQNLGLDAYFAVPKTEEEKNALKSPRSAVCFDAPSWYELVVEGKKVAGSAQTRQKGVILQHGSILLDLDEDKLIDLFLFSNENVRERMKKRLMGKAVSIKDLTGKVIPVEEAKSAFKKGFEDALNIELEPLVLTNEQIDYVEELALKKYMSDEWNFLK